MLSLFKMFFSWATGDIASSLERAYTKKLEADTDAKKLAAEFEIEYLKSRQQIISNAQSDPWERFIRILWTLPFIIYVWKLVLWDKVFEFGITDNLSQDLWNILYIVLAGYFLEVGIQKWKK